MMKKLYILMVLFAAILLVVCLFAGCKKADPLQPQSTHVDVIDNVRINITFHCTEIYIGWNNGVNQTGEILFNRTSEFTTSTITESGQTLHVVAVNRTSIHDNIHVEILINGVVRSSQTAIDSASTSLHL